MLTRLGTTGNDTLICDVLRTLTKDIRNYHFCYSILSNCIIIMHLRSSASHCAVSLAPPKHVLVFYIEI